MKIGGVELPALPALPALALPRLPLAAFRRRLVVRGVFVLLMLATLALAVTLLIEEKQRGHQRYEAAFRQRLLAVAAQLRHPTGQLALLNADAAAVRSSEGLVPLVLPFSALDFDDPFKARQAVEMSGCAQRWHDGSQLCVAVGRGAYAGGFVYLVASFAAAPALARERGTLDLAQVSHARITLLRAGGQQTWLAPFEAAADAPVQRADGALRGRLSGFAVDAAMASGAAAPLLEARAKPDRDFRGWLWQDAECAAGSAGDGCVRQTLLSIRLPVAAWREALFLKPAPPWPPADLQQTLLRVQWLGAAGEPLFDSSAPGAERPFALEDLAAELSGGEALRITRADGATLALLRGVEQATGAEPAAPWLVRLVRWLPVQPSLPSALEAEEPLTVPAGRVTLKLTGDSKSSERSLSATATRLAWFVGAMVSAIALAWLVIEVGFMRRMVRLTQRAAALAYNMQDPQLEQRLGDLDVTDLRGKDELGILAGSLAALLQRVKDAVRREHIRAEQEREQWHAVGHEIMSPLQSLLLLHADAGDASHRYVQRMQQAVRVLYGTASPSEAIAAASLAVGTLDIDAFLGQVAANAAFAGIADVRYERAPAPLMVRADEYSLEDVVTHVLRNADRHRRPGTPITLRLGSNEAMAELVIHNQGTAIDPALLERIFEYGVSGEGSEAGDGRRGERRGQGLFVARTYMAKMGGTVSAGNRDGGVAFVLRLQRA